MPSSTFPKLLLTTMVAVVLSGLKSNQQVPMSASNFLPAFLASFMLILGSEIGDKTFFIAAILSMKHSHVTVFAGAIGALTLMTILSAALGVLLPTVLSKEVTHYSCIALFLFFGVRLLYDVYTSEASPDGGNDELKEVEIELTETTDGDLETSRFGDSSPSRLPISVNFIKSLQVRMSGWWSANDSRKVFLQSFVMTFLAEWGDRSQISTIALASAKDPIGVTIGGIFGHMICTGGAVIGGKLLASRISERNVNLAGGTLFIFFAISLLILGHD
jgi:putative Ca2+/H+ antiporter (TMEM165/GDT1 family)